MIQNTLKNDLPKLVRFLEDIVNTLFDSYQNVILLYGLGLDYLMHYSNTHLTFYLQLFEVMEIFK